MIKLSNYWVNFFAHFTILTIVMAIVSAISPNIHGFIPMRILIALGDAYVFPIFKTK
jgi:hypothetical protein